MKKKISILGSTGSIGLSTFEIINKNKNYFKIELLAANKNYKKICSQILKYNPNFFIISNLKIYKKVKIKFKNKKIKIFNSFKEIKKIKTDITVSAIPGIDGLYPTILLTKFSKKILIANKESVICGWEIISKIAKRYKTKIIPIDSEHFSIFELIKFHKPSEIKKIYITASGGPFLNLKRNKIKNIKPHMALSHPKWKMGRKISIDSATMMNKIFEFIEAQKIFNISEKKIEIIIHPESLVHAIVEFKNGLRKFIYHETSMIIPLANAIFEEEFNIERYYSKKFRINKIFDLTFQKPDYNIFPTLRIKDRANEYPSTPIIINACNEIFVDQFLKQKVPFFAISNLIKNILNDRNYKKFAVKKAENINQILLIDIWAKNLTKLKLKKYESKH